MTRHRITAVLALLTGLCATGATALPAAAAQPAPAAARTSVPARTDGPVVAALDRAAHPLRTVEPGGPDGDLRPLDRMIGGAGVVGLGEATHSSHEFFALKDRVFRHLVEKKGFRTFALEAPWSTGRRLDDYVVHGKGDPRRIMREEFQRDYLWWDNTDYLRLLEWMRAYDVRHPGDPVRFLGDDIGWAGPEVYDTVTGYVARTHPEASARLAGLYRGLRPAVATGPYIEHYLHTPYPERAEMAGRAGRALTLLKRLGPGGDRAAYDDAVRNATAVDQVARQYAYDFDAPAQLAASMRYRDATMAANVAEWRRRTGGKVLLSAHDAHVGYVSQQPAQYPKMQGAFLRDRLGAGYVSVGLTFDRGSFNATGTDDAIHRFTLGPAGPGTNEATLDRVRLRDYLVDLRTLRSPARDWLDRARPTRSIGTAYPDGPWDIAPARSHDVLIHLHRVEAARLRDR
ncbi:MULTISPECIES: erythromycin esterase family protein [Streptomyces]|uniref:erythromycin esterase family protein n=1 Tax=Streptomyces TaxID=1883 RepID=UPI0004CCA948|nr:erythromycin esterase family protein [Streptomyces durhamensis]